MGVHSLDIHFGTVYFGQERQFTAILVNHAPHPSSYSTVIESKTEDEEMLVNFTEVSAEPSEGTVDPLSKTEITIKVTVDIACNSASSLQLKSILNLRV